ncbi:MAG: hypothetical protein ACE5HE_06055, partial [Phycisphaerae bacterium]
MSFRQALTASISALVACAVTLTACDIPVSSIPNIPEPSGGGQGQALPQPDFTANLELNRSLLIRGDTQQGSAVATARANSIATFEWCVDEVAPDDTVEPCTTGSAAAIAARSLLDLDIPPTFFNSEGRLIESRFTDPNVATSELQRSTLTIRKVNGDPGPTGSWIRITVATTLVQGAGDADDRFILSGTCDDGAACDVQAQDCADASVCEPVRTTRTRLLKIVRPPSELAVSISAGSARVSPDGSVELAATISGGTPFVEGEGDGTTATVPCDRYCIEWTPDESRLSPEVIRPAGEEIISIKPLPPFDPSGTGQTVSTVVYTAPKAVGSVTFRVDVTDKRGNHATDTVAITVSSETALGIAEASSSGGEDGRAQLAPGDNTTLTIRAAAGEAPYTVTLTILNTGLLGGSLSQSSCTIGSSDDERAQGCSVTYRAPIDKVGTALINVTIEDAVGATESTIISLPVSAPLNLSVTLAEEGSGVEPRQTVPILATIVGGTPPYTACYLVPTGHGSVGGGSADCGPITIGDDTFGACTCGLGDPTQHGLSLFEEERNFTAPGARDSVPIRVAVQDVVGKRATDILTMLVSSSATPPPNVTPGPGPLTSLDAHATNPNVCLAQTTDIQATATGGTAPYTFTFSIAGVPVAGESVTPPSVSQSSPTATATYTAPTTDSTPRKVRVTVDEAGGTSQTSEVQITPPGLPSADAGADLQACATELVPVGAVPTASGGKPPYTYTWTAVDRAAPGNVLPSTVFDNSSASNPKFIPGVAAAGNGTSYDISVEVKDACGKTVVDVARIDVNRSSCDDGNDCTANVCSGGACTNPMLADGTACADDGNVCTDDVCRIGTCEHENNSASCDDGNACTTNDTCANGACVGGAPPDCDDANVCTDDSCDPATGCTHDDNTAPCDDGNACTTSDTCAGGACVGGAPP